ncbi:MAG: sialidase domain-containing protein, partial [Candidatus Gracilibacteria bacterium]|nr:sialidase domain-containing protein [Candidatus Gracilibacteria bacterium]
DVCFVLDNVSTNTFASSTGCLAKKNMSLKSLDGSLVGYWDMETCTGTGGICGVGDKLKDLSGNGGDGSFSGNILPIGTGGYMGKGYYFSGNGASATTNYSMIHTIQELDFKSSPEFSVSVMLKSEETCPLNTADFTGPSYASLVVESSSNFNTNTGAFSLGESDYSSTRFTKECQTTGGYRINLLEGTNYSIIRSNNKTTIGLWKTITLVSSYSKDGFKETALYINGVKQGNYTEIFRKKISGIISNNKLYFGSRAGGAWSYKGIIDDVKIYNRALSDSEIRQQAKIAGF